ncbi:MAG: ribonuclease H-like YkuK family protein [Halanaerobiales bacterium]|nr:ribonuclease H-like YkuK family protein [Halanaerobiales bacterium]
MSIKKTYDSILSFINEKPNNQYKLIIGTDSHPGLAESVFVTAIVIYRVGHGGRYFYHKKKVEMKSGFKKRIFHEVSRSLTVASKLTELLSNDNESSLLDIEIHIDVGQNGSSSEIIKEVVGMVIGSGYDALIKPDSYAASNVADRYTK